MNNHIFTIILVIFLSTPLLFGQETKIEDQLLRSKIDSFYLNDYGYNSKEKVLYIKQILRSKHDSEVGIFLFYEKSTHSYTNIILKQSESEFNIIGDYSVLNVFSQVLTFFKNTHGLFCNENIVRCIDEIIESLLGRIVQDYYSSSNFPCDNLIDDSIFIGNDYDKIYEAINNIGFNPCCVKSYYKNTGIDSIKVQDFHKALHDTTINFVIQSKGYVYFKPLLDSLAISEMGVYKLISENNENLLFTKGHEGEICQLDIGNINNLILDFIEFYKRNYEFICDYEFLKYLKQSLDYL